MKINIGTILLCLLATGAVAQQAPLTLEQAVQQAMSKYPAIRVSQEQVSAAAAAIKLARTSYLPRADFLAQANRATHNNVFGMFLLSVISPISGPVLGTNSLSSVWGTAVGATVAWEPFDFGLRKANIAIAESARNRAGAQVNVTKLQVAAAAADAYLTILAAQQTVTAAKAGVERARVLNQIVGTLVKNELRPGAEESRTRAELAVAETQLIQAEEAVEVGRATLAQLLGVSPQTITVQSGPLLNRYEPGHGAGRRVRQPVARFYAGWGRASVHRPLRCRQRPCWPIDFLQSDSKPGRDAEYRAEPGPTGLRHDTGSFGPAAVWG